MKSLLVGLVVSVFVLAACSSGGSSADSGTVAGEASGSTRGAGDSTPTTAPVPEETSAPAVLPQDTSVAQAEYKKYIAENFLETISDETLDCMVEAALGEADAEQLAEITEENFSDYVASNGDLVDTLFEDEDASAVAQFSAFRCLTDEEFKMFLVSSGGEPEEVDCALGELGGQDGFIDLLIESELGDGSEPPEFAAASQACGF